MGGETVLRAFDDGAEFVVGVRSKVCGVARVRIDTGNGQRSA